MRCVSFRRFVAVAVALAFAAVPASVAAQDDSDGIDPVDIDVYWDVMVHVVEELAYFAVLDRMAEPLPDPLADLPVEIGIGDAPTGVYEDQLQRLERIEGPLLLEELVARGLAISGPTWQVLWVSDVDLIDADVYLAAYEDALWLWWHAGGRDYGFEASPLGAERLPAWWTGDGRPPILEPVPPVQELPSIQSEASAIDEVGPAAADAGAADESAPLPGDESTGVVQAQPAAADPDAMVESDPTPLVVAATGSAGSEPTRPEGGPGSTALVAVGAGGGVVLVMALLVLRVRRDRSSPRADELLESGRRFLAASSVDELGAQVAASAHRLSGATGAVFLTDDRSWTAGSVPALPDDLIGQVRATGKTVRADDRAVVSVLSAGQVVGVIGVTGPDARPEVVEQLAPLAGEGLANLVDRDATEQLAFVDALTEVPNRRRFDLDLDHQSRLAAVEGLPVAVAMIDVDHFKTYNDVNGHQEGDEALRSVAQLIGQSLREQDTVYRYGGEEFVVLLPGADFGAAQGVAERIRRAIESHRFAGGPEQPAGRVTVSIGISTSPPPDGEVMVEAADAALYRAKNLGRNRVVLASELA